MDSFPGKVAVITGGASGIGFALAKRAAGERMKIVLADIEAPALEVAEQAIRDMGAEVFVMVTDTTKPASVEALAHSVFDRFGRAHLLFNNAGVGGVRTKAWEATANDWAWVMGVNVFGVINGVRAFTPRILKQGEPAHIVNTASVVGFVAMADTAPYAVSKHGVVAFSEVLYHDLRAANAPIGVSVLCPAFVPTNIWNSPRNRPPELIDRAETTEERTRRLEVKKVLDKGKVTAEHVADLTFEAIREGRFYIFPHPKILRDVRTRMEDVLALRNPTRTA